MKCVSFQRLPKLNIKTFRALFVRAFWGLQTLVQQQEARNSTLLVLVLVNPDNTLQKCLIHHICTYK